MRTIRISFCLLGTAVALHAAAFSAVAQQDTSQVRRATVRHDSLRIVMPSPNESLLVLEHVFLLRRIADALDGLEADIRGPNRVLITKTGPSTFQGLQEKALDVVTSLNFMCSSQALSRTARLGVEIEESIVAARNSLPVSFRYPRVLAVERGSPAAAAGLAAGDEIIAVDDIDVRGRPMKEFITQPGRRITLTLDRNGMSHKVHATLDSGRAEIPLTCEFARKSPYVRILFDKDSALARVFKVNPMDAKDTLHSTAGKHIARSLMGGRIELEASGGPGAVGFISMKTEILHSLGAVFSQATHSPTAGQSAAKVGVRVLVVSPNTQFDRGGLKPSDLVTRVGKKQITSVEELKASIDAMGKQSTVEWEVLRNEKATILRIPMKP